MRLVIVESPYAAPTPEEIEMHVRYARACVRDCLDRGEAPFASHLLLTQPGILRDEVPAERTRGIEAGLAWAARADATVVYLDLGLSRGMKYGIEHAVANERHVEVRVLSTRALHEAIGYRAAAEFGNAGYVAEGALRPPLALVKEIAAIVAAAESRR